MSHAYLLFLSIGVVACALPCPEKYTFREGWCFVSHHNRPGGLNFSGAITYCASLGRGNILPVVSNLNINKYLSTHDRNIWIGIDCNRETGEWKWPNNDSVTLKLFQEKRVNSCTNIDDRFGIDHGMWKAFNKATLFPHIVCARPAESTNENNERLPPLSIAGIALGATLLLSAFVIAVVSVFIRILRKRRARRKELQRMQWSFDLEKRKQAQDENAKNDDVFDDFEIDARHILIDYDTTLGKGYYGRVFLGRILDQTKLGMRRNNLVAVKMIHETSTSADEDQFRNEIMWSKMVGTHDRIAKMIACVTVTRPLLLIMEYCSNKDLLSFLQARRQYLQAHEGNSDIDEAMLVDEDKKLRFAMQISHGMLLKKANPCFPEYLSARGIVHRDIAARNVLLDENEDCKVSDFGLCRRVARRSEQLPARNGPMPVAWMAPEAVEADDFSTASDTWSYGILLYEIVTLGAIPYADWSIRGAADLVGRLKRGDRMECPNDCSDGMYDLMKQCWRLEPSSRPDFATLRMRLAEQLDQASIMYNYIIPRLPEDSYLVL